MEWSALDHLKPRSHSWATFICVEPRLRAGLPDFARSLSEGEQALLVWEWEFWARGGQTPPAGAWRRWALVTGPGYGRTRAAAEWVRRCAREAPRGIIALLGRSGAIVRDTMIDGESGVLACSPIWERPTYHENRRQLRWPNGVVGVVYSDQSPGAIRGGMVEYAWAGDADRFKSRAAFDNIDCALRYGRAQLCLDARHQYGRWAEFIAERRSNTAWTLGTTNDNLVNLPTAIAAVFPHSHEVPRIDPDDGVLELFRDARELTRDRTDLGLDDPVRQRETRESVVGRLAAFIAGTLC